MRLRFWNIVAVIAALVFSPLSAFGAGISFDAGGVRVHRSVRSLHEMRQSSVVRQRWDLSCGPAALSTLLTHHFGDPVSEAAVVMSIMRTADPEKIRLQGGFSLLDLKRFARSRGYEGKGYGGLTLTELAGLGMPAIVPARLNGYDHFVVFRELRGDRVILADPAFGTVTMTAGRFLEIWDKGGIAFIVFRPGSPPPRGLAARHEEFLVPDGSALTRATLRMNPVPSTRLNP
jgi:hypothetical protein